MRVLSDLSEQVVDAVIDPEGSWRSDAFSDALRRYEDAGAPAGGSWRDALAKRSPLAAGVLRRLTRDLLHGVRVPHEPDPPAGAGAHDVAMPENVRPIERGDLRDLPALEQAGDGTWRPSGSGVASSEELDAKTLRRSVDRARSRYPEVGGDSHTVLPPPPRR